MGDRGLSSDPHSLYRHICVLSNNFLTILVIVKGNCARWLCYEIKEI